MALLVIRSLDEMDMVPLPFSIAIIPSLAPVTVAAVIVMPAPLM